VKRPRKGGKRVERKKKVNKKEGIKKIQAAVEEGGRKPRTREE